MMRMVSGPDIFHCPRIVYGEFIGGSLMAGSSSWVASNALPRPYCILQAVNQIVHQHFKIKNFKILSGMTSFETE